MNKKLLLIAVIFIIIVIAVALTRRQPAQAPGSALPPTLAAPAPTTIFTQPPNVTFSFASTPIIPSSLPSYTVQPAPLSSVEQIAAQSAPTLGLNSTPSALTRGGSYTNSWSRPNEAALTVTKTNDFISLSFHQVTSGQTPQSLAPDVAAQQFLALFVPSTQTLTARVAGTTNGPFEGLLVLDTPAPTSFTNYFYSYYLGNYPVLTPYLSITPASVIVDGGGIVRFANIVPPPTSVNLGSQVSLLTKTQVLASLTAGRGALLNTHNPQDPEEESVPTFSKFIIEDTKIVYAPKDNLLLPALYMDGVGEATGGATQEATIFLWLTAGLP